MGSVTEEIAIGWWNALRQGERSALSNLYSFYYPRLMIYGRKFTSETDHIKDSINAVFLYIWEKRDTLSEAHHVGNYLFKAFQRQLNREGSAAFQPPSGIDITTGSDEDGLIARQEDATRIAELKKAILNLPKRQRELIFMKYYEGFSYGEITAKTGLSTRAVYNQIHTAIQTLRKNSRLKKLLAYSFFSLIP